jgi:hypothetical protein
LKYTALALLVAASVAAQQQQPVVYQEPPVYVTAIELVADVRDAGGEVPKDLKASDFVVLEDGVEQNVIGVDYVSAIQQASKAAAEAQPATVARTNRHEAAGWQIVLFFDLYLSSPTTIRSSVASLMERADELAKLGQVSIVVSSPDIDFKVMEARNADQIREGLRSIRATAARNWLARHRRQYQQRSDQARGGRLITSDLTINAFNRQLEEFLRSEILAEVDAVERFQAALLTAIGRFPRRMPRALFVVSEGFELDTSAYYNQFATNLEDITRLRSTPLDFNVGDTVDSIARVLAASGWTTIGVHAPLGSGEQWMDDAARTSIGRVTEPRAREALHTSERGNDPLIAFAVETGGTAGTPGTIARSVQRLEQALIISYQVSRQPDGKPRSIEIRSRRPGLEIKAFKWATESTPSELAATRTLSLLSDVPMAGGDLPTTVALDWTGRIGPRREGMITVNSSLAGIAPLLADRQTVFRVTIVVGRKNMPPTITHRTVTPKALNDTFSLRVPIEAGDEPLEVAATVEELTSGLWGGRRAGS